MRMWNVYTMESGYSYVIMSAEPEDGAITSFIQFHTSLLNEDKFWVNLKHKFSNKMYI